MSEKQSRHSSYRGSMRSSLQSSQMSDRNLGTDDEDESIYGGAGDSMSFAMRSANHSFLSGAYRQDNDSDWDDDDGRRSVRSAVSATSSRRPGRSGGAAQSSTGSRASRLYRADGNESLEASLNSLRSSRRSSRRRPDNVLDASFHSRASARSVGSRASARSVGSRASARSVGSRAGRRRDGRQDGEGSQNGSFLSDGASEDLVTSGFASPLFALGPGTFAETRSLGSSHRGRSGGRGAKNDRGRDGPRPLETSESYNSGTFGALTTEETRSRATRKTHTRRSHREVRKVTRDAVLRKVHVPLAFVTAQLAHRRHRIALCRDFFLFIPLLILFCFFAEYDISNISRSSLITQSLRQQYERHGYPSDSATLEVFRQQQTQNLRPTIQPTQFLNSVSTSVAFNDFYINSILQGTFALGDLSNLYTGGGALLTDVGHSPLTVTANTSYVPLQRIQTLRLVGALRARTIRVRPYTARVQENLYEGTNANFSRQAWAAKVTKASEATTPVLCPTVKNPLAPSEPLYTYRACADMRYKISLSGSLDNYHCGGYMFEIPFSINSTTARAFTSAAMANCSFISTAASRLVVIEFFTYMPSLDGFTQVKFMMETSAGGYSITHAQFRQFFVYTSARRGQAVFSGIVLGYTVFYFVLYIIGFARAVRAKALVHWMLTWYHWVDLALLAAAFASFGCYFQWVSASLGVADDIRWPFPDQYPLFLDYIQSVYVRRVESTVATTIFLFIRLFRFVEFWTPMNILWGAVLRSLSTGFAVLVIYALMLVAFSLCGWAVFGPFSPAFRTIDNAIATLSLFFISDTWYYPIDNVNVQFQFLFFWAYLVGVFALPLVALCSVFANAMMRVTRHYVIAERSTFLSEKLITFGQSLRLTSLTRFCAAVLGVRHDHELMEKLTQQLCNFNRVQQDFYLFGIREKMDREIDDRMREYGERRAAFNAASQVSPGAVDDIDVSGFGSPLGESLGRSTDTAPLSSAALEASGSASALEVESKELVKQMLSSLAQSMSAYVGSSVDASDLGFGALFENSTCPPELQQNLDDEGALARITEHVRGMYASQLAPHDVEVRYTDWTRVVPADLYKACGGQPFFEDLWVNQIVPAWTEHLATPAEKARTEFIEHTQRVTRATLAMQLTKVKLLDSTLRKLEAHVAVAQDVLDARNADDRESSDGEEV